MKRLLPVFFLALTNGLWSQCPSCDPDLNCISNDGFPTICPLVAPIGYTGEYYEHTLTFFIPAEVIDPGSQIPATLLEVTFTSVSGMPYGLEFTLNDDDGVYHPSDGENHGCATVCGIPLIQGTYNVLITVNILATAFGFEVNQVQSFPYTLIIEPGEGGTSSFTFDNPASCGGLEVNYEATVVAPDPAVTTYDWDFGNGQTSTEMVPGPITYDSPGEYQTILTTTVANYQLSSVSISNLSSNWDGDVDDFFSAPADPYFIITDGNATAIYTSSEQSNTTNTSWADINIGLAAPPYSIQFFDADDISDDDDLGTTTVVINEGTNTFDVGNGTVGSIVITLVPTTVISDTAYVNVFPFPDATYNVVGNTLVFDNPELTGFIWYINDIATDNFTNSIELSEGGEYYCVVSNEYGCSTTSDTYLYCPEITVQVDELAQEVFVDDVYETYQWFYNGLEIDGATLSYVTGITPGNYAVEVTTSYGCTIMSEVLVYTNGIGEKNADEILIYPNPFKSQVSIVGKSNTGVRIWDIAGKQVAQFNLNSTGTTNFNFDNFPSGTYIAEVAGRRISLVKL